MSREGELGVSKRRSRWKVLAFASGITSVNESDKRFRGTVQVFSSGKGIDRMFFGHLKEKDIREVLENKIGGASALTGSKHVARR